MSECNHEFQTVKDTGPKNKLRYCVNCKRIEQLDRGLWVYVCHGVKLFNLFTYAVLLIVVTGGIIFFNQ